MTLYNYIIDFIGNDYHTTTIAHYAYCHVIWNSVLVKIMFHHITILIEIFMFSKNMRLECNNEFVTKISLTIIWLVLII